MNEELEIVTDLESMVISPGLIQELFDKDPLELTDQDLTVIIAKFRADRLNYLQPPEEKKAKKASTKAVATSSAPQLDLGLSLSDLGL